MMVLLRFVLVIAACTMAFSAGAQWYMHNSGFFVTAVFSLLLLVALWATTVEEQEDES